jgi:H/ACA ribonucleoprotein complex subunit 4
MHIHDEVAEEKVRKVLKDFIGTIIQLPPIKSAVKREERERNIYYIDVLEIEGKDVLFKVGCQAGTYIRKLCHDIGVALGCGAHMAELRRTKAGCFDESTLSRMQDLADAYYYWKEEGNDKFLRKIIKPIENAILHVSKVWVVDSAIESLTHGRDLAIPGISKFNTGIVEGDIVAIMTLKDEFVGIGNALMTSDDIKKSEKGIAVKTHKVFMKEGLYKYSN